MTTTKKTNGKQRISIGDLVFFNRQIAAMIKAKLPLPEGLGVIAGEMHNKPLKRAAADMEKDLEAGVSLSEAFERQEGTFPELYASMIKAGEESGDLPGVLSGLCEYSDAMWSLKRKIKAAMFYPAAVGAFIMFILPILAIFIIPRMAAVYENMDSGLPVPTRLLLGITDLLRGPWGALGLLATLMLGLIYLAIRKTGPGRKVLDRLVRAMPFFGRLSKQAELWRFCRTTSVLLKAGVPLTDALKLVSATSQNAVMKSAIDSIHQEVSQGESLGNACRRIKVFPENMVWIIAMGEERGTLNDALNELTEFYDLEVRLVSEKIQSMVEPALVACLGGIVAVVLIALYMPVFNMAGVMSGGM